MITGLDHVQIAMPAGQEAMIRDYCVGVLGLTEIKKPETLAGRGGVWFALLDGRQLHYGVEVDFTPNKKAHPAFTTAQLQTLAERLAQKNLSVIWDEALAPRRRFYSQDPFGNRLEFMEEIKDE